MHVSAMHYYPPAVSGFDLSAALRDTLVGSDRDHMLDEALCEAIGCRAAVSGTSWVLMLALLLRHLKRARDGHEVVLAGYSCNEFTKATLLAGLRPVYVEVDADLRTSPDRVASAFGEDTLAAFAINNVGVESDNRAIARRCQEAGVVCVEDATYTYLGHSDMHEGVPFGSFGDFAILNFSEGKTIPVGGGAVLLNSEDGRATFEAVRDEVYQRASGSLGSELLALLIYKVGSSSLGYGAYRRLAERVDVNLKQRLSMEPTRPGENATGLHCDEVGRVQMRPAQAEALAAQTLRPLGRLKQHCGLDVVRQIGRYRRPRKRNYDRLRAGLRDLPHVHALPLPENGIPVRLPVLVDDGISDAAFARLNRLGVDHHYTPAYPMHGDPARPHTNRFYEDLYTLPVHERVRPGVVLDALDALPHPAGEKDHV